VTLKVGLKLNRFKATAAERRIASRTYVGNLPDQIYIESKQRDMVNAILYEPFDKNADIILLIFCVFAYNRILNCAGNLKL
jgi:hypothetical protein